MSILIKKSGVLDTFQDLGRKGYAKFGINPTGAMDRVAVRLINVLLGNNENETALEMHFPSCEIEFEEETIFALGGADFSANLNGKDVKNWTIRIANKGDTLKFSDKKLGNRCYLSVKGGFKLKKWLDSSSTNFIAEIGGFEGRKLKTGDRVFYNSKFKIQDSQFSVQIAQSIIPFYSKFPTVRVVKGAEFKRLTALSEYEFLKQNFSILQDSNRMGFRLKGKPLHLLNDNEILSTAVNFGTIQMLPNGQLVSLMADHQTTGGYPRIAHIIEQDLPLIAQLGVNDGVGFHLISVEKAEEIKMNFERDLAFLKMGVKFAQR